MIPVSERVAEVRAELTRALGALDQALSMKRDLAIDFDGSDWWTVGASAAAIENVVKKLDDARCEECRALLSEHDDKQCSAHS